MSEVPRELQDEVPVFDGTPGRLESGPIDWTALTAIRTAKNALEVGAIVGLAAAVFFGIDAILRATNTPTYVFPRPIDVAKTLVSDFGSVYAPHLGVTMEEFLVGLALGSTVGLLLAVVITQRPFAEKVVAPYIIIMITTPMVALVPFLRLKLGFGLSPIILAVALASGPMVLINAATGFRRTDLAKIALARSYGASTLQVFLKVRFPLALPMIIIGYMVGSIFGLLTAVSGEMVAASERGGLGHLLMYFASLARTPEFGAVILIIAGLGVAIYVIFYFIGKRWASWEA